MGLCLYIFSPSLLEPAALITFNEDFFFFQLVLSCFNSQFLKCFMHRKWSFNPHPPNWVSRSCLRSWDRVLFWALQMVVCGRACFSFPSYSSFFARQWSSTQKKERVCRGIRSLDLRVSSCLLTPKITVPWPDLVGMNTFINEKIVNVKNWKC